MRDREALPRSAPARLLRSSLAPRMPRIRPWIGAAVLLCGACGGPSRPGSDHGPEHRLLVVGWDGATFDLIDPLVRQGRLPTVQRLLEQGSQAWLESTVVPISSAAWVGAMTGTGPGRSGVYSFFEPTGEDYDVRLVSSRSVHTPPLWRILRGRGLTTHVWGVPLTFPPERTDPSLGITVAGMLSPFDATYAWPADLAEDLRARGFVPDLGLWRETQAMSLERFEQQLAIKQEALLEWIARPDWDAAVVVFKSLDVLSHQVYDGRTDGLVAGYLERLDATLAELVEAAGPDANVVLLSDHGFATYPLAFNLHTWLVGQGYSVPTQGTASSGDPGAVALADARAAEHRRRIDELDLGRTRAVASTCEGNFGGLRLNRAGREARGCVEPGEAEALLDELEAALRAWKRPDTGEPLVTRVWRGAELYPGPLSDVVVPDLLFEVQADVRVVSSQVTATFGRNPIPPDHTRDGILVAAGPGIARSSDRGRASILDVAPTLLGLLDEAPLAEMDGDPVPGLRAGGRTWPDPIPTAEDRGLELLQAADPFDEAAMDDVVRRLQQLGYVDR